MGSKRSIWLVLAAFCVVGCSSAPAAVTPTEKEDPGKPEAAAGDDDDTSDGAGSASSPAGSSDSKAAAGPLVDLPKTSGLYRSTCDGSGAVMIDATHFLDVNDEEQTFRIYERGSKAAPVQSIAGSKLVGVSSGDEADLEELTRRGDRVYGVTSHGRKKDGELDLARFHFYAFDVSGAVPNVKLTSAGTSKRLVQDLVTSARWETPDAKAISALSKASRLDQDTNESLAPEDSGLNIEGLVALPSGELVIGFRNPGLDNGALAVTLTNPDDVLAGQPAHFGKAFSLDLGGLRIRALAWSATHESVLIVGGGKASGGTFRLFRWVPSSGAAPAPVADITPPDGGAPEAIVTYPSTKDVQVLFDQGDDGCKDADVSDKSFTDVIVHVD
jgi:hypothetical protein